MKDKSAIDLDSYFIRSYIKDLKNKYGEINIRIFYSTITISLIFEYILNLVFPKVVFSF